MPAPLKIPRLALFLIAPVVAVLILSPVAAQPPQMMSSDVKLVERFDENGNGFLEAEERKQARAFWEEQQESRPRRRPRRRGTSEPPQPGKQLTPGDVESIPEGDLFDRGILRTIFLDFDTEDWEKEMEIFKPTDVEVPATMTVDGQSYPNVGVSFRGASSFFMIPAGLKRSLNISMDLADSDQRLYGYKSLNLLNINGDASMMSSLLYSYISSQRIATPKVNYVRVVINGENWGIYVNSQQFNKVFIKENFSSGKGARWKVPGSPRGDGGLRYLGEEVQPYKDRFEIKSGDKQKSWDELIRFCKLLNETPVEELEEKLSPVLDIQGCLWFLAVDLALSNSDGYWTRASDYHIYLDPQGKFHILPHDMNEAFHFARRRGGGGPPRGAGGPPSGRGAPPADGGPPRDRGGRGGGGGGFGGGGGVHLEPLHGIDDDRKPLRSVLLKHPEYQKQYLQNLRDIALMLQWENLGPIVAEARALIEKEVSIDTKKLTSQEAFLNATDPEQPEPESTSLRSFAEQRSGFLLNHELIKNLPK